MGSAGQTARCPSLQISPFNASELGWFRRFRLLCWWFWVTWFWTFQRERSMTNVNESKPTKCDNCDHEWSYNGKYSTRTTCPDCQRKTTIGVSDGQQLDDEELKEDLQA